MEITAILQVLPSLSISDRLKIAESALQLILRKGVIAFFNKPPRRQGRQGIMEESDCIAVF